MRYLRSMYQVKGNHSPESDAALAAVDKDDACQEYADDDQDPDGFSGFLMFFVHLFTKQ